MHLLWTNGDKFRRDESKNDVISRRINTPNSELLRSTPHHKPKTPPGCPTAFPTDHRSRVTVTEGTQSVCTRRWGQGIVVESDGAKRSLNNSTRRPRSQKPHLSVLGSLVDAKRLAEELHHVHDLEDAARDTHARKKRSGGVAPKQDTALINDSGRHVPLSDRREP